MSHDYQALMKKALLEIKELKARLSELERVREPIAIVGMSGRFPGADSPAALWALLAAGKEALRPTPPERWDGDAFYDPAPDAPAKMIVNRAGFLDSPVNQFDPQFWGIAPREATSMDPQQRLLLELCWEALEDGGQAPDRLRRSATGVFMALATDDYAELARDAQADLYSSLGVTRSIAAGRISYLLGLQGPNIQLDTACSSSLVTVHLACQALRLGECDLALAGGINLILSPQNSIRLSRLKALSPNGRCRPFDAAADGFVRGEGGGVVVLKRLSDALTHRDRILAVIRGSAVNHDGPASGLTVPNEAAQADLLRRALHQAAIAPHEVSYIEAHGTGTVLGDPIEVQALGEVFAERDTPLFIGSLKSNIGHLEAAAGVAGLIKAVLALNHGAIPPSLHFEEPNPHIAWDALPVRVVTALTRWPTERPIVGVSSFGLSGTNAHLLLAPAPAAPEPAAATRSHHLLVLSAHSAPALDALAERHAAALAQTDAPLADIAFTAATGRSQFPHRIALVAATPAEAATRLRASRAGEEEPHLQRGVTGRPPRVAFLFTGQGAQRVGMGRTLYESEPTFRAAMERCETIARPLLGRSLLETMWGEEAPTLLHQTLYTQPALFALEYALTEMWRGWGVEPAVLMGHSLGEYAAACAAGVFSLEDALRLVIARGQLMGAQPAEGAMVVVRAGQAQAQAAITACHAAADLSIAALNGPENCVLAGRRAAVERVSAHLQEAGVKVRSLAISHAFHCPLVEPILAEFAAVARSLTYHPPRLPVISNLTGGPISAELTNPDYWVRHLREPVRFADGMSALHAAGITTYLELGPDTTLLGMGRQSVPDAAGQQWLPSQRREQGWEPLLTSLGHLYVAGADIAWDAVTAPAARQRVALPTYPWQRQRYWLPNVLPPGRRTPWPAPDALAQQLEPSLTPLLIAPALAPFWEVLAQFDTLTLGYIRQALNHLGWHPEVGSRVEPSSLADALGIVTAHRPLFARLLEMLSEADLLRRDGDGWRVLAWPPAPDPDTLRATLLGHCPDADAELTVIQRCGAALPPVLRGEAEPLESLFPAGDLALATRFYQDAPFARIMNSLVGEALRVALARWPAGRPLRVLEIGAGTGGTTAYLLPSLSEQPTVEYWFTDVGRLFVSKAQARFADYPFLRYAHLNIEEPPAEQGFAPHTFDLILAANVIHATRDIRQSLAHVQTLLAPGGLLMMLETTARQQWVDLFAGFTGGWWRFQDHDLRSDHPLLSVAQWLTVLRGSGFESPAALTPRRDGQPLVTQPALLLALAPASAAPGPLPTAHPTPAFAAPTSPPTPALDLEALSRLGEPTLQRQLATHLAEQVRAVLGVRHPDPEEGFFEMGMDSLTAVELKSRLEQSIGLPVPISVIFDHSSIASLSHFLVSTLRPAVSPAPEVASPPPTEPPADLDAAIQRELAALQSLLDPPP